MPFSLSSSDSESSESIPSVITSALFRFLFSMATNPLSLRESLQERSKVTKFLMGLNDGYERTRRHILMLKPLPKIENAFNIVAHDERQKMIKTVVHSAHVVFYAHGHTAYPQAYVQTYAAPQDSGGSEFVVAYNNYSPKRPLCTHCGLLGHTFNKCYQTYGYPPGYRIPPAGNNTRPPSSGNYRPQSVASNPGSRSNQNSQHSSRSASQKQIQSKDSTVSQVTADVANYKFFQQPPSSDMQLTNPLVDPRSSSEEYRLVN